MKQSYKTYSVRIPTGPISDFIDASGKGVFLRKLFYESLGLMEAQKYQSFICSNSVDVQPEDLSRYAFREVYAEELARSVRKNTKILILCEGETEAAYLQELVLCAHATQRVKVKKGVHSDPLHLILQAEERLFYDYSHQRELLEVWVVFDRDNHVSYRKAFEEASKYPQIKIAWSNPCFEFWFLLHCRNIKLSEFRKTLQFIDPQTEKSEKLYDHYDLIKKLKECIPSYRKADKFNFHAFRTRTLKAIQRSLINQTNPYDLGTSVGLLIQRLCVYLVLQKNFWDKETDIKVFTNKAEN